MAVRFVFGPAGSGKTFRALEALRECRTALASRGLPRARAVHLFRRPRVARGSDLARAPPRARAFSRFGLWLRERRGEAAGEVLNSRCARWCSALRSNA